MPKKPVLGDDSDDPGGLNDPLSPTAPPAYLDGQVSKEYGALRERFPEDPVTLDDLLSEVGFTNTHYVVIAILSIVTVGDVMEAEVGILLGPKLLCEWTLTGSEEAMITASVYIGALFGSMAWGSLADKSGRKYSLCIMLLWVGLFGLLTSFTGDFWPFIVLRFCTGIGLGGAYLPVTYCTELVHAKYRSFATFLVFIAAFFGTIAGSALAMFTLVEDGGWKIYISSCSSLVMVSALLVHIWVPESPRFLLMTGQNDACIASLRKFNALAVLPGTIVQPATEEHKKADFMELIKPTSRGVQFGIIALSWFLIKFNALGVILLYFERLQDDLLTSNCNWLEWVQTSNMTKETCREMGKGEYMQITIFNLEVGFGALISFITAETYGRLKGMLFCQTVSLLFAIPMLLCVPELVLTVLVMISKSFSAASWYTMSLYINEYFPTYIRSVAAGSLDVFGRLGVIVSPFIAQSLSKVTMFGATSLYLGTMLVGIFLNTRMTHETKGVNQSDNANAKADPKTNESKKRKVATSN